MKENKIQEKLWDRLEANYNAYMKQLQGMNAEELIQRSKEIAAANLVYEELHDSSYSAESIEYLLRFENPLEVVRDQWLLEHNTANDEEISHVLWNIADKRLGEGDYAMLETEKGSTEKPDQGVRMC